MDRAIALGKNLNECLQYENCKNNPVQKSQNLFMFKSKPLVGLSPHHDACQEDGGDDCSLKGSASADGGTGCA